MESGFCPTLALSHVHVPDVKTKLRTLCRHHLESRARTQIAPSGRFSFPVFNIAY
jgi:hypothetical protein